MPEHRGFVPGSWLADCDTCGRTFRSYRLINDGEFPGTRVCMECWDPKHPQELIRPIVDDGSPPPWTRPEPPWVFDTTTLTANYTVLTTDDVLFVDASNGSFTVTLCAANAGRRLITIVRVDSTTTNTVTVQRAGADTFVGGGTSTTVATNAMKTFDSNGATQWQIL